MHQRHLQVRVVSDQEIVKIGLETTLSRFSGRVSVSVPEPDGRRSRGPDVIVYDISLLEDNEGKDLHRLMCDSVPVVAVAPDSRRDLAVRALADGVVACLPLSAAGRDLFDVVEAAACGRRIALARDLMMNAPSTRGLGVGLTPREVDVITLIARGLSNAEIATQLYVSINSVKTYIRTSYRKIGLASRSQVVGWAIRNGVA